MSAELKGTFAALPRTTRGQSIVVTGRDKNFLYTHGNSVFIRNIQDPAICDVYTEHSAQTTVARYSPSGYYIASADTSGKLRIWDTVNVEHILKNEFQPFAGPVKDLDWSGDNQRIVVGGQGREMFSHVINAETGTSVGDLIGHSKAVNSVTFKQSRPFRIATAAEDQLICFYHGPPFKFNLSIEEHRNFVNCVRYSPDDSIFVSGGSDGKAFKFDGKTGELLGELGSPAHKGGIYAVCFSPDSSEVLTVSGDKSAKIWKVEDGSLVVEFVFGKSIDDMQVACLWLGDVIMTVSLSGYINYLDRNNPSAPSRIVRGHNKQITKLCGDENTLYSGDAQGRLCIWNAENGTCEEAAGNKHSAQIQGAALCGNTLVTCSIDDTVRFLDTDTMAYRDDSVSLSSQPQGIDTSSDGFTVVVCSNEIMVLQNGRLQSNTSVNYQPSSVSIHPGQTEIAVGGTKDNSVHVYSLSSGAITEVQVLTQTGAVTTLSYSPDGAYLATGNANRKVCLYSCPDYQCKVEDEWTAHTAKVLCLAWSPNSQHIATGGIDANVIIWNVVDKSKIKIDRAHRLTPVSDVFWRTDNVLTSAGHDSCIKQWIVKF